MRRSFSGFLLIALVSFATVDGAIAAQFAGPNRGVTGNDTGGIFPYSPAIEPIYQQIAADFCAQYHRLSHVTSVHRRYGDYVSFVCIDKPWMIH